MRDKIIVEKIIGYCRRIADYLQRNNNNFSVFESDYLFQDACCMCVVQIGEMATQLSDELLHNNPAIPWRIIKDTRNFYVHAYGEIDLAAVWSTLNEDIPLLQTACEEILKKLY